MEQMQLILSLIEGTNDLIQSVEPDGSFEFVNRAWLDTLGYSDVEFSKLHLKDVLFPGHLKSHEELIAKVLKGETRTNIETIFVAKDGTAIYVEGNLFPRRIENKIVAATGFFRDITSRKRTEEKLIEATSRNEFFVDLLVHDLMNINQEILSMAEILLMSPEFPKQLEGLVREGLVELEKASRIASNIRKMTKIGAERPRIERLDLWSVVSSAAATAMEAFPDKKMHLRTDLSTKKHSVLADEYLKDVFFSLFHNSMKFDKSNDVKIEIDAEPIKHTPFLRIQVMDHGPGIPDEEKESVFDGFTHRRESIMGLGLGLTLIKTILDSYGAFIRVEDRVEGDSSKGTKFVLLLRHMSLDEKQQEGNE
jgi:PAS domain S-box-containing protein